MPAMDTGVIVCTTTITKNITRPTDKEYDIILWNNDVTSKEVVTAILVEAFGYSTSMAASLMLYIHFNEKGKVGTYPMDKAYELLERAEKYKNLFNAPELFFEIKEKE